MKRRDKPKEIADELRASAMTPQALARKRQKELLETLEWLLAASDNHAIFVARVKEKFDLKDDDPRWKAILAAWDAHLNP